MTKSHSEPLRWGVLSAARILGKVVPSLLATGGRVVVVGASRADRAEAAAAEHGIERAAAGYAAVLRDPEVEAVYVPLVNSMHREWALAAAAAGKHCLCEKPLAMSAADAREIRDAYRAVGRRCVEAFMWRHHPQVPRARELFAPGNLGDPRRVHATFSFPLDRPDDYRWVRSLGGGALLDLGGYCVNAARYFFRREPVAASARAVVRPGEEGVDESVAAWLDFGDGRLATFSVSFASGFAQGMEIVGTEGRARLDQPWNAMGKPVRIPWQRGFTHGEEEVPGTNPYREMAGHFTQRVRDPDLPDEPAEDGVAQAVVLDALRSSFERGGEPAVVEG